MTLSTLAILGATIVFTSFLSGVFGMAGGMILLGILLRPAATSSTPIPSEEHP